MTNSVDVQFDQVTRIILPRHTAALSDLSCWVHRVARKRHLSSRCAFRLELVLVEAVTNVIEHGESHSANATIEVQVSGGAGLVIAQVEDAGLPFNPTALPEHRQPTSLEEAPIGGLGLHLMRSFTESLDYRRIGGKNQLRMTIMCDVDV